MASRAEQKAAARAAREARLRQHAQTQARRMRLLRLGGLVAAAGLAIVIIVLAVGGGGGSKTLPPKSAQTKVAALLNGIPQSGNVLGKPSAPVTMIEYADLVCPFCQSFTLGGEETLIRNQVRAGKVKIEYHALETASGLANGGEFAAGQIAARAAGLQHREWNFILTWYFEQKDESQPYVTDAFIRGIAQQVPGLNLSTWQSDRNKSSLATAVTGDEQAASKAGYNSTPTIAFQGPKGNLPGVGAVLSYSQLQTAIKQVS